MDIQKIKELALANGFKLKEQADGSMDLNAYVYDFANAIEQAAKAQAVPEGFVVVPKEPTDAMLINGNRLALADKGYRYDATSIWETMIEAQEPANDL
ncbi:hypothetical protein [Acinetobacter sp. TR11]|uniref:hypothetical protein n=1 Tax=Acinetobacter sp. TR11 TaxID=3003393 RepID=UPI0022AC7D9E|nr:hypothetical protein [Acinetobacter sp. TR11]WAU72416.1 hypothetical protein O1450_09815 [Acinetobacter sp. TR11]